MGYSLLWFEVVPEWTWIFKNYLFLSILGVEEQLVEEDDEDTYTLSKLGDLVHALFAAYKEAFLPCFEQLLPYATKLLVRTKSDTFSKKSHFGFTKKGRK